MEKYVPQIGRDRPKQKIHDSGIQTKTFWYANKKTVFWYAKKGVDVNCVHSFFQYINNSFSNLDYKYTIHYTVGKQTTVDQNLEETNS